MGMTPAVLIALGSLVVAMIVHTAGAVYVVVKVSFIAGEFKKTIDGHSRLFSMIPCLKPRACPVEGERA